MRAKFSAMTHEIPVPLIDHGAISREDPQPKLVVAISISPCFTVAANVESTFSRQCLPNSSGSAK